jgi:hypothetical protein
MNRQLIVLILGLISLNTFSQESLYKNLKHNYSLGFPESNNLENDSNGYNLHQMTLNKIRNDDSSKQFSQKNKSFIKELDLGLGFGLDYGGIGGFTLISYLSNCIGIFGSVGITYLETTTDTYQPSTTNYGIGSNFGAKFRYYNPDSKSSIVLLLMYGHNTTIKLDKYKTFNGPTMGLGFDKRFGSINCLTFEILIPVRDYRIDEYMDDYHKKHYDSWSHSNISQSSLSPISLSIGYKFIILNIERNKN